MIVSCEGGDLGMGGPRKRWVDLCECKAILVYIVIQNRQGYTVIHGHKKIRHTDRQTR